MLIYYLVLNQSSTCKLVIHVYVASGRSSDFRQELSYRKQIARQQRTQFVEDISVTLKSRLRVTQNYWKRNHWVDHTRLTISRVSWRWILSWPWNVGQRSLKVIENGTIWKLGYGFLFAFIVTMAVSLAISEMFNIKERSELEIWVWRRSRSLEMALFDRSCMIFYRFAIVSCNYSSILYRFRVIWRWIISWPWNLAYRSLKVIEIGVIRKLGCGFLFAFYSNYSRICSHVWAIQCQWMAWPWKPG